MNNSHAVNPRVSIPGLAGTGCRFNISLHFASGTGEARTRNYEASSNQEMLVKNMADALCDVFGDFQGADRVFAECVRRLTKESSPSVE